MSSKNNLKEDVDELFRLPLAEFTSARNALAARLKKSGREEERAEAARVKALAKPSISAWAVNQLYWNHREEFDQLIASGERFHKAQTSRSSGKVADMRAAMDARRESLSQLSHIAASVLRDAGHNPALDTIHRITTTLEALSAYASRSDARHLESPGHLTQDIDPPGFESFGAAIPAAGMTVSTTKPARGMPSQKSSSPAANTRRKTTPDDDARQLEEMRKAKMAAARASLQEAKRSLTEARAKAKSLEVTQKRVLAKAKEAENNKRDAEERLEKAQAAAQEAARRVRSVADEVKEASTALNEAEREVEEASRELEKLFGEYARGKKHFP